MSEVKIMKFLIPEMNLNCFRKSVMIWVVMMLCFLTTCPVYGTEIPLEIQIQHLETEEEILVSVIANEPVALEAFTFSIEFDNDIYKLHKGYDVLENGYGYTKEFLEHYSGSMMLANDLDDKVLFSGVCQSEGDNGYEGIVAQAALLKYNVTLKEKEDIKLVISALQINGERIPFSEKNASIEETKESAYKEDLTPIENGIEALSKESVSIDCDNHNNECDVSEIPIDSPSNKIENVDSNLNLSTVLSQDVSTNASIEVRNASVEVNKPEAKKDAKKNRHVLVYVIVFVAGCGIGIVLKIKKNNKRSD